MGWHSYPLSRLSIKSLDSSVCPFNLLVTSSIANSSLKKRKLSKTLFVLRKTLINVKPKHYACKLPHFCNRLTIKKETTEMRVLHLFALKPGGAEGSRTPVQTYSSKAFYMLILFYFPIAQDQKFKWEQTTC